VPRALSIIGATKKSKICLHPAHVIARNYDEDVVMISGFDAARAFAVRFDMV